MAATQKGMVSALEKQFAMIQNAVKAGKVTPGVSEVIDQLEAMITNQIEPAINSAHTTDQQLVNTTYGEVTTCQTNRVTAEDLADSNSATVANKKNTMTTCRDTQATLESEFNTCDSEEAAALTAKNSKCTERDNNQHDTETITTCYAECNYKVQSGEICWTNAKNTIANLEGFFNGRKSGYDTLATDCNALSAAYTAKVTECDNKYTSWQSKIVECDGSQSAYETANCNNLEEYNNLCTTFDICWSGKSDNYATIKAEVQSKESDRKNEWTSVQTIKCMLQHYQTDGTFNDTSVQSCQNGISTSHLDILYPTEASKIVCSQQTLPNYC
jgi:hypothetical protein